MALRIGLGIDRRRKKTGIDIVDLYGRITEAGVLRGTEDTISIVRIVESAPTEVSAFNRAIEDRTAVRITEDRQYRHIKQT